MPSQNLIEKLKIDSFTLLDEVTAVTIADNWLSEFCPTLKNWNRSSPEKMYLWDSMKCDHQKDDAINEYEIHKSPIYFIMPDSFGANCKIVYETRQKPISAQYLMDFHVFPKNLAWCMTFTHEDGWIGPLFSKNRRCKILNRKNEQAIEAIGKYGS